MFVRVTDNGNPQLSDTEQVLVTVLDVNEPPTITVNPPVENLLETTDTTNRVKVADILISDDGEGVNIPSLSGPDAADFEIVGDEVVGFELFLRAGTDLDSAIQPTYEVIVNVDDTSVGTTPDDSASFTLNVLPVSLNNPPVIEPNQEFFVPQFPLVPLDFSLGIVEASDPDVGQTLTYTISNARELEGGLAIDPSTGELTVIDPTKMISGQYDVEITVFDDGTPSLSDTEDVLIRVGIPVRVDPIQSSVGSSLNYGRTFTGSVTFQDLDGVGPWTVTIRYGDGTEEVITDAVPDTEIALKHRYFTEGNNDIEVIVEDAGGESGSAMLDLDVSAAQQDAFIEFDQLIIVGTSGNNSILVNTSNPRGVTVSGVPLSNNRFDLSNMTNPIEIFAGQDADVIRILGPMTVIVHGGEGNDFIFGSSDNSVIYGGPGNDYIRAGSGHNVLIGGSGRDTLVGSSGRDILIDGDTTRTIPELVSDLAAWVSTTDPAALTALFSASSTDGDADFLIGGTNSDAFIYQKSFGPGKDIVIGLNTMLGDSDEGLTFGGSLAPALFADRWSRFRRR